MPLKIDIHDYPKIYRKTLSHLKASLLSDRNKKLILEFDTVVFVSESLSLSRRIRLMGLLGKVAQWLDKGFDKAAADDIKQVVGRIGMSGYSPWTVVAYKSALKKFYKRLKNKENYPNVEGYPPEVRWMKTHLPKREQPKIQRASLLTPGEVKQIIDSSYHPQDKALVSMAWETGGRVGEWGSLRISHLVRNRYGFHIHLDGKTGKRECLIVESAPYVEAWLKAHPFKGNPEAPLWLNAWGRKPVRALQYRDIRYRIKQLASDAGIQKRITTKVFRHSRATYVLANNLMNEVQAKKYFGWAPDSSMIETYTHLITEDVDRAILAMNGIQESARGQETSSVAEACLHCGRVNSAE